MTQTTEGKGGSYIRNPDGTLSLVERTLTVEEAAAIEANKAPSEPKTETPADEPETPAPSGKKK